MLKGTVLSDYYSADAFTICLSSPSVCGTGVTSPLGSMNHYGFRSNDDQVFHLKKQEIWI